MGGAFIASSICRQDLNEARLGMAIPVGSLGISIFITADIALPGTACKPAYNTHNDLNQLIKLINRRKMKHMNENQYMIRLMIPDWI